MSERIESMLVGTEARRARRSRIKNLIAVVTGNKGWRQEFLQAHPRFDTYQGTIEVNRGQQGRSDDPALLEALESFVPHVIATEPDWWVKRPNPLPDL